MKKNTWKRIGVCIMCILFIGSMSLMAFALEQPDAEESNPIVEETLIQASVSETYTVTIPAALDLTISGSKATGSAAITASGVTLETGHELGAIISAAEYYDTVRNQFRLSDGDEHFINFYISHQKQAVVLNQKIALADSNSTSGAATLNFEADLPEAIAGDYNTTLTFTIYCE